MNCYVPNDAVVASNICLAAHQTMAGCCSFQIEKCVSWYCKIVDDCWLTCLCSPATLKAKSPAIWRPVNVNVGYCVFSSAKLLLHFFTSNSIDSRQRKCWQNLMLFYAFIHYRRYNSLCLARSSCVLRYAFLVICDLFATIN